MPNQSIIPEKLGCQLSNVFFFVDNHLISAFQYYRIDEKMRTRHSQAITKLQTLFLVTLLIVASASGLYYYIESEYGPFSSPEDLTPPDLSEFSVYGLTFSPNETEINHTITISVKVSNVGEGPGNHTVVLEVNGMNRSSETVHVLAGENTTIEFHVSESVAGTYNVKIANLIGTYKVTSTPVIKPPPVNETAEFKTYSMTLSAEEAWVNQTIVVSVNVKNIGETEGSYIVNLKINNIVRDSRNMTLVPGGSAVVPFSVVETEQGKYTVEIDDNFAEYEIVPTGMHTLKITISPTPDTLVPFDLNGEEHMAPFSELLPVGAYEIEMPPTSDDGKSVFSKWNDKKTNPTRTVYLNDRVELVATYTGGSSCPSLYIWNGTDYEYVAEISNHGWLGYIHSTTTVEDERAFLFWRNDPWDYLKLDSDMLVATDGSYELLLSQRWNEIFYLDSAYMVVVDHPSDVDVYSTGVEQYLDPAYMGQIYTVNEDQLTPVSAFNEAGEDVLALLSEVDGVFTPGINGLQSPSWDNISWNTLTLDLGDLSDAEQIKLVVNGKVDWGSADDYNTWLELFYDPSVPDGSQVTPPPFMEVKDEHGNWVSVPEDRQFPIPPDVNPRTWVVDLTGLFPTDDYSLRINNFWNVTFDYLGVDTSSQLDVSVQRVDPSVEFYKVFEANSASSGTFTAYSADLSDPSVLADLLLSADDEYIIGRQGEEVRLRFSLDDIAPLEEGMERSFFLFVADWFKDEYGNWGFGFDFTVDPLPFLSMSGFPYPLTESYPYDEHVDYFSNAELWRTIP